MIFFSSRKINVEIITHPFSSNVDIYYAHTTNSITIDTGNPLKQDRSDFIGKFLFNRL